MSWSSAKPSSSSSQTSHACLPPCLGCLTGMWTSAGQKLNIPSPSMSPAFLPLPSASSSLIFLIGTGIFGAGRPWASPFLFLMLLPPLPMHKIGYIQCWRIILLIPILSISCHHHPGWGVMAMASMILSHAHPHLDYSIHWEYFLLCSCVNDVYLPSKHSQVSCPCRLS